MPSNLHESFVDILRSHRGVALRLALQVEVPLEVPAWQWLLVPGEFADPAGSPELFRTDLAMVAFADPADPDRALESLHVEAQLGVDPSKSRAVPIYRAGMRSRYDCPGWGLMLSPVDRVIEWATNDLFRREPELRPFIVGRQHVQPVLDLDLARSEPEWAALTAALHARGPHACQAARIALEASVDLPRARRQRYNRLVQAGLSEDIMQQLRRELPPPVIDPDFARTTAFFVEGRQEGLERGREEGLLQARRSDLLVLLPEFGLTPTDEQRALIETCTDADRLQQWILRVHRVASIAELLSLDD